MSLLLNTGAMHYRENVNDEWKPLVIKANADLTVLADEYSNASTYVVGEYCRYDGQLYRCTTAITTAESWTPAHWTETNIGDELASIKEDYLPLTAGEGKPLTGALALKSSANPMIKQYNTVADTSTTPSDATNWTIYHVDKNNNPSGYWQTTHTTNGTMKTVLAAVRKVNGSGVENALNLYVGGDGSKAVAVTSPAAWRSALSLGTSGEFPITIAQGGTGQTAVTSVSTISNIITAGPGFQIVSAGFHQWGKLAQLYIKAKYVTTTTTTPGYLQIGTLVSGKRPVIAAGAIISDPSIQWGYIGSSGPVYVYGTWQYNTEKDLIATFLLA